MNLVIIQWQNIQCEQCTDSKRLHMMLYSIIWKTFLKKSFNRNLLMNQFQPIAIILSYHLVYQPGLSSSGTWCPRISVTRCCWWKWTRYLDFIFYSMTHGPWVISTIQSIFKHLVNICTVWYRPVPMRCAESMTSIYYEIKAWFQRTTKH